MVIDQQTNFIYFADTLYENCKEVYESIINLQSDGLPIDFIPCTKDIWARDYMPIQVAPNKFVAFTYNPNYLQDTEAHRRSITSNAAEICQKLLGDSAEVIVSDIVVDGGNVIKCDDAVIMVDKVIRENPHYSASKLLSKLEDLFGCEVFLIPWDPYEKIYGHSDGVLRYIGEGDLLFTKYPDYKYIKEVKKCLEKHFNKMHDLWMPSEATILRQNYQWAYINYIRTKDYILVPALSKNADCVEDVAIVKQFRKLFPEYNKDNIRPVYALPALKQEGGLHCCSWNIYKP